MRLANLKAMLAGTIIVLGLNPYEGEDSVEDLKTELKKRLDIIKSRKAYTTFAAVAVQFLGLKNKKGEAKYNPSMSPIVLGLVEDACGPQYTALIVNEKKQHHLSVAVTHRTTLEGWGYTDFPRVSKPSEKSSRECV